MEFRIWAPSVLTVIFMPPIQLYFEIWYVIEIKLKIAGDVSKKNSILCTAFLFKAESIWFNRHQPMLDKCLNIEYE
jgi:hypothetical protein